MMKVHAAALLGVLVLCAPAFAQQDSGPGTAETLDEVQVRDAPGPLMWRVSKDDHVLWIIGTLAPVPKDLKWNTTQLQAVVKESGEVVTPADFRGTMKNGSVWTVVRNLPALLKLRKNADGAKLRDLLPPEQYQRWRMQFSAATGKEPDEDAEETRPMLLADQLYFKSLEAQGLVERDIVLPRLASLAKEHKVPIRKREIEVSMGDAKDVKQMMAEFRALPRERELECLVATMDYIDQQLPRARERARAWATGEPALLSEDLTALSRESCTLASVRESSFKELWEHLVEEARQDFLDAAAYALLGRETAVTSVPMQFISGPKSLLDALRASGYKVESPR